MQSVVREEGSLEMVAMPPGMTPTSSVHGTMVGRKYKGWKIITIESDKECRDVVTNKLNAAWTDSLLLSSVPDCPAEYALA